MAARCLQVKRARLEALPGDSSRWAWLAFSYGSQRVLHRQLVPAGLQAKLHRSSANGRPLTPLPCCCVQHAARLELRKPAAPDLPGAAERGAQVGSPLHVAGCRCGFAFTSGALLLVGPAGTAILTRAMWRAMAALLRRSTDTARPAGRSCTA